jgi:PqqD family protein of HPr-rel-A system
VSAHPLDDELVVFDSRSGEAFVLNTTAAFIWTICDGSRTVSGIRSEFAYKYGLDARQARADVADFLLQLGGSELLVPA